MFYNLQSILYPSCRWNFSSLSITYDTYLSFPGIFKYISTFCSYCSSSDSSVKTASTYNNYSEVFSNYDMKSIIHRNLIKLTFMMI
jgi:hypothetical protein